MKVFKRIDCRISMVLIPSFIVFGFIKMSSAAFTGYYVVGGWQLISMIVHQVNGWYCGKGSRRYWYHRVILLLVIITGIPALLIRLEEAFFIPLLIILFVLLILSPLMAVYYAYLCYNETFIKMKRPMELLK